MGDELLQALQSSGVAGGLVVVLGWLIRQWLSSVKDQLTKLDAKIEHLDEGLSKAERILEVRTAKVDHFMDTFERRLERLEAKGASA